MQYGIPLDSRANFTKADWLMWIAALGNDDQVYTIKNNISITYTITICISDFQFNLITDKVYKFANETADRHAFPDWYI